MLYKLSLFAIGLLVLGGCAAIERPDLPSNEYLPLNALTESINCELRDAIKNQISDNRWLEKWQGQYSITLKANQVAYLKLNTSTFPIILPQKSLLNFGVGAGVTSTANRTALFKYNISFKEIAKQPVCVRTFRPDGHPFLVGEIGFREWFNKAIAAFRNQNDKTNPDKLTSIGHTFEFSLDANGAVSPAFVLMPTPTTTINPAASFDRLDDNIVDVSFGKTPDASVTLSDIKKILSSRQRRDQEEAGRRQRTALTTFAEQDAILSLPENRRLLTFDARIVELQRDLSDTMTKADILSSNKEVAAREKADKDKKITALQKTIGDLEREKEAKAPEIAKLQDRVAARNAAQQDVIIQGRRIKDIEQNPAITRTETRQFQRPQTGISPDLNYNVTQTLLQLQLERLVNSRLPVQ